MDMVKDIDLLTTYGNLGFYTHCEVFQAVLIKKDYSETINYFTHINFQSSYQEVKTSSYITEKPTIINNDFKLAISTYTITINKFRELYISAIQNGTWDYNDEKISGIVLLDDVFSTEKKFVPENDPTGGQYNSLIPLEDALYGSNFMGNYYIHELYSNKNRLNSILDKKSIEKIQTLFKRYHINYKLDVFPDRIGNVLCKFKVEVIFSKPKSLGYERGISFEFIRNPLSEKDYLCVLQTIREHDRMIYENKIDTNFVIGSETRLVEIEPNQCKNTITLTNINTGLINFMAVLDYSIYSNYHSQIKLPYIFSQGTITKRKIRIDGQEVEVDLSGLQMAGDIAFFIEMYQAGLRQQIWQDKYFADQKYFLSYKKDEHQKAISDIIEIINSKLIWDLQEIWLIDPYLTAGDIIKTALLCKKYGIKIKGLCSYKTIHGNSETKDAFNAVDFESFKNASSTKLMEAVTKDTDIILEYRTTYKNYGADFHDRYLILKYDINKDRVWSLGTSINSIGKSHHTIQIVEAPTLIVEIFSKIWDETNCAECKIFRTSTVV
ncbi:MAG TPA: VPA1262 family N-terminal domain-containing protein [Clostridia bacterium]